MIWFANTSRWSWPFNNLIFIFHSTYSSEKVAYKISIGTLRLMFLFWLLAPHILTSTFRTVCYTELEKLAKS